MPRTILDEYKKAIIEKYQIEKLGENLRFLENPSRAKLRNLCWERFKENKNEIDLKNFETFFEFSFDLAKKNELKKKTGKFRSIGEFFRNETESPTDDIIELAAILVDFGRRPYNNFRKFYLEENSNVEIKCNELISEVDNNDSEKDEGVQIELDIIPPKTQKPFANIRGKILVNFKRKLLWTGIVVATVFLLIITTASFFKKDCMIWVNDHYEELERSEDGYCDTYYDARYFDLKKIAVCDTTAFFDNNGKPKVWYIKVSSNSIECFDRFAPYPLNTRKFLKPITQHMITKYLANRPKCK